MEKNVTIIEDDADLLAVMTDLLTRAGYRVSAFDRVNSVEELLDLQPDMFIIDEQLPGVTGHIPCIILKSKPQTAHIPIILMSGHPGLDRYATLGNADHFLTKPFELEQVIRILDACVLPPAIVTKPD